jgi:pimeloyl-ACP methyl ester carboxylesterase
MGGPGVIDVGTGTPVVLIPGIQGRWEWMGPTVEALASRCRVLTFSLWGEPGSGHGRDQPAGFDSFVAQIDSVLDGAGLPGAALCGVSFGGLIAMHYAAVRPERVTALVLASTPSPRWRPDARVRQYLRAPRLLAPLFVLRSPFRLGPEILAALHGWGPRMRFTVRHVTRVVLAPFSPVLMTTRVRLLESIDLTRECSRVRAPALIVTGEPHLDRVVPVQSTWEYLTLLRDARRLTLERTGHIGSITQPDRFAAAVSAFAAAHDGDRDGRGRSGGRAGAAGE